MGFSYFACGETCGQCGKLPAKSYVFSTFNNVYVNQCSVMIHYLFCNFINVLYQILGQPGTVSLLFHDLSFCKNKQLSMLKSKAACFYFSRFSRVCVLKAVR